MIEVHQSKEQKLHHVNSNLGVYLTIMFRNGCGSRRSSLFSIPVFPSHTLQTWISILLDKCVKELVSWHQFTSREECPKIKMWDISVCVLVCFLFSLFDFFFLFSFFFE